MKSCFDFWEARFDLQTLDKIQKEYNGNIKGIIIQPKANIFNHVMKSDKYGKGKAHTLMNDCPRLFRACFRKTNQIVFSDSDFFINFNEVEQHIILDEHLKSNKALEA